MRHLDLFSGIGGFALAARNVWGTEYETEAFCEIDPYCQQVLKKNFGKDVKIYGDIRTLTNSPNTGVKSVHSGEDEIFLLTGGFPCQPFSQAGKRKGANDDRHLWPEMLRVIQEFKPTWVVAENVRGLITISEGLVFEQVCTDLEEAGYDVQAFIIPACAINAPHRRDRLWIVAHSRHRDGQGAPIDGEPSRQIPSSQNAPQSERSDSHEREGDVAHAPRGQSGESPEHERREDSSRGGNESGDATHSASRRFQEHGAQPSAETYTGEQGLWERNWTEVAAELCGVDDGLPAELDGFKLSKAGHRVARLKALGNAIVPGVAEEIFKGIKRTENGE